MLRLRRYARALTGSRDDADNLVHDTLERAWGKSDSWHGVGDLRAWLFGIMHNLHVDGVRRPGLHTVTLDDDTPEVPVTDRKFNRMRPSIARVWGHQTPLSCAF